jgi:hypothetical protein
VDLWSPWLQQYLAAVGFFLFGPTTWAARAPFAFFEWLSLVLLALTAYRIYRDHRISLAAVLILGTSEVFLLHARQCRYYGLFVFLEVLFILGICLLRPRLPLSSSSTNPSTHSITERRNITAIVFALWLP